MILPFNHIFNSWEAEVSRRIFSSTISDYWDTTYYTLETNPNLPHNISSREEIFAEVFSFIFQFDLNLLPPSHDPNDLWEWIDELREPLQDIKLYVYNMANPDLKAISVIVYPGYNDWPTDDTWPSAVWARLSFPFVPGSSPDGDPWFGLYQKFYIALYYTNGNWAMDFNGFDPVRGYSVAFTSFPLYKICIGTPATQRTFNLVEGWNLIGNARCNNNLYPDNLISSDVWDDMVVYPNQAYNYDTYITKPNVDEEKDDRYEHTYIPDDEGYIYPGCSCPR